MYSTHIVINCNCLYYYFFLCFMIENQRKRRFLLAGLQKNSITLICTLNIYLIPLLKLINLKVNRTMIFKRTYCTLSWNQLNIGSDFLFIGPKIKKKYSFTPMAFIEPFFPWFFYVQTQTYILASHGCTTRQNILGYSTVSKNQI